MAEEFVDNYLLYLLARASEQASRQFHAQLKSQGIRVPDWRVLAAVSDAPRNIGELARITLYQQPTLTKIVDRMAAAGLVERVPDEQDGRGVRVRASAAGEKLALHLKTAALVHEEQVLSRYSEKERVHLKGILRQLINRTDEDNAKP